MAAALEGRRVVDATSLVAEPGRSLPGSVVEDPQYRDREMLTRVSREEIDQLTEEGVI